MTYRLTSWPAVIADVRGTLGEAVGDYDVEAIAREAFVWSDDRAVIKTPGYEFTLTDREFWALVERHRIPR
jgi:hypothetical protein